MSEPSQEPVAPEAGDSGVEAPVGPVCRHLRSKGMYVYTDGMDYGFEHNYDSTLYWCLKTMKAFGPDDDMVEKETCCRPDRPCYQPL